MNSDFLKFQNLKVFPNLDLFRALSIVLVMLHHSPIPNDILKIVMKNGNHGVSIFFIISGFLISTLLIREKERGSINIKNFLIRRGLRIYPLYYTVLLAYYIAINYFGFFSQSNQQHFNDYLFSHIFYFSNLVSISGPFFFSWSLSTEEQFYFIFSFVIKKFSSLRILYFLIFILAVKILFYYFVYVPMYMKPMVNFIHYGLRVFQEAILLGVILAILMSHQRSFDLVKKICDKVFYPSVACFLYILFFQVIGRHSTITAQLFNLSFVIILFRSVTSPSLDKYIGSRLYNAISYVGLISYGIYLFHMIVSNSLFKLNITNDFYLFFLIWLFVVILIASISFELYERRFMKMKSKFK